MRILLVIVVLFISEVVFSQSNTLTKEDTLLGSITPYRAWWDVKTYMLSVKPDFETKTIVGINIIGYKVVADSLPFVLQLDLQEPMQIDSVYLDGASFSNFKKEKNRWLLTLPKQ